MICITILYLPRHHRWWEDWAKRWPSSEEWWWTGPQGWWGWKDPLPWGQQPQHRRSDRRITTEGRNQSPSFLKKCQKIISFFFTSWKRGVRLCWLGKSRAIMFAYPRFDPNSLLPPWTRVLCSTFNCLQLSISIISPYHNFYHHTHHHTNNQTHTITHNFTHTIFHTFTHTIIHFTSHTTLSSSDFATFKLVRKKGSQ